ncbi:hypothetical protein EC973_000751 [Apophysomyces ossiformis]|uniref:P-type ATPase A domain-containing protein n=1 Tax=Apophysomyces ossiformis TaxID=679940 RepID=A0A8H7BQC0_9FUNG|nr:hypothetical protein EC973_000751 [Apophysomyces ossiformis]
MKLHLIVLSGLLYLPFFVEAFPRFNKVNAYYHNGTACPAVTKYDAPCPILCVPDRQYCPEPIRSCPNGQLLCGDGSCQPNCAGIANVCSCPSTPGVILQACRSLLVNISHYDPANAEKQTHQACAASLGVSGYPTWADISISNMPNALWNVCTAPAGMVFPTEAPFVICYLTLYLAFYIFLACWIWYKSSREKEIIALTALHDGKQSGSANDVILKGFQDDWAGYIMVAYVTVISVGWIVFLLMLSLDYYGYVKGTAFILTYGSYDLSSKAFCVLWFLATSWYLALNLIRSKLRNFFRVRQTLDYAQYVQIEKQRRVHKLLVDDDLQASGILRHVQEIEAWIRKTLGMDVLISTVPVETTSAGQRYIEFESTRYTYSSEAGTFEPSVIVLGTDVAALLRMKEGLTTVEANQRREILGPNFIAVHVPNFVVALWQELTGFFYVYQIMILWCYFYLAYWQIGVSDTGVILLAAIIKVIVRIRSETRVKRMAEHVDSCKVLRDGEWETKSTADLVPGDVFSIHSNQVIPVDAVILQGDIVVDESSLTGEPLPIRKFPLREDGHPYDRQFTGKIHSLFAGTTVKQSSDHAIALVLETRTNTDKGKLVQKILHPQLVSFVFNEQLKLVFAILICWAIFLLGIGVWWLGGTGMTAWFYGTLCAAQVMNPLLPAILVVGQSVAAARLKKKSIFCVDFPRILMAGKVQVFCFDKTGTLTKEGLEYYGVYPARRDSKGEPAFGDARRQFDDLDPANEEDQLLRIGIASCHSVTTLGQEYIGNPVDIVMFHATGASISAEEGIDVITTKSSVPEKPSHKLKIIQRFEFQHARASMSVAALDTQTGHIHIFCKGSFERIQQISSPTTIPADYDQITSHLAREGCYVLGMAHRDLGTTVDADTVRSWTRDELESNLSFLGLVLFKNLLKEDTKDAITQLKAGDTRAVMITGDNVFTGVFVGQACGLVPSNARVLVGDTSSDGADTVSSGPSEKGVVIWTDSETNELVDLDAALLNDDHKPVELAVTGKAFRALVEQGKMRDYLFSTRIFARMTPVDKMVCVQLFMERAVTAMCGDGGNDCGALRTAHVGIAMSDAEASVVSPFSTPRRSVQSCVDLLIEGRAALATSFASYKYLIMYGETMATVKFCTFYYTMSFSQWNFILIDAFITMFCAFAVTQAGSAHKLSHHRPTARILGLEVLLSVLGQLFINAWFLIGAYIWLYTRDDFFRCHEWDARAIDASKWWLLGDSFEADILTFITLYQFVNAALIFNYGYIFRARWYRNYLVIFLWSLFVAIVSYWELADPNAFGCLMRVNCGNPDTLVELGYPRPTFYIAPYNNLIGHNVLPRPFRYKLWAYSIGNMLVTNAWELVVILGPVRNWLRKQYPLKRLKVKQ